MQKVNIALHVNVAGRDHEIDLTKSFEGTEGEIAKLILDLCGGTVSATVVVTEVKS